LELELEAVWGLELDFHLHLLVQRSDVLRSYGNLHFCILEGLFPNPFGNMHFLVHSSPDSTHLSRRIDSNNPCLRFSEVLLLLELALELGLVLELALGWGLELGFHHHHHMNPNFS
jgi:hypothetical protein